MRANSIDRAASSPERAASSPERAASSPERERRNPLRALTLCLCCLLLSGMPLLMGCGSGGGHAAGSSATTRSGKVTITIVWPQTKASGKTRVIPDGTQSVVVSFRIGPEASSTQAASVTIPRGAADVVTDTLDNLPLGTLYGSARAYPTNNGTGTSLATAEFTVKIQANQSTNVPVNLNSAVAKVSLASIPSTSLILGQFLPLTATATSSDGSIVPVAPSSLQWSSSAPDILSVSSTGVAVANKQGGPVTITVGVKEAPSLQDSLTLTVNQGFISSITIDQPSPLLLTVGAAPVLTATIKDNNNNTIKVSGLTWKSDNPAVALVDPNSGALTANALGAANISATALGQTSAALIVRVGSGALDHIVITPSPANAMPLTQGQQLTLTAVGYDKANNLVGLAANNLAWKSADTNVADGTLDSSGSFLVTAHYAGTTNVTVTDAGSSPAVTASLPVTVRVNVSITPVTDPIPLGGTAQFMAAVTGTDNHAVTWSVQNNMGQITTTGLYTAPTSPRAPATYTVIAASQADSSQKDQTPIKVAVGSGQIQIQ